MFVGERRNGNLLVQLDPKLQAQPVELLRQRWSPDGHTEYLIRWAVHNMEEMAKGSGNTTQAEAKFPNILMWMSAEEVYTNCPTLLGKRKPEGPGIIEEKASGSPDEAALQEMMEDVRMLVQRAARQMSQSSGPDFSILNTIHVLSAYASIGSLAGVFKEIGALDLLMKMLCNTEKQIRNDAGKMLQALASHDAGSRAHVLLSLSQQDGIEQHMDFESRYTLLQLFAETTSSEEHCISFDGIHLPQVPGKQLFSLVKRYLCVTSLLDQLSSDRPDHSDTSRLQRQFGFSMAMGSLICELVRVMGWADAGHKEAQKENHGGPILSRNIFPLHPNVTLWRDHPGFLHRSDYIEYLQRTLLPGMAVRISEDYDLLSAGDEGVFLQSIMETPPVQVRWCRLQNTLPVHWHMLEICSGDVGKKRSGTAPASADRAAQVTQEEWWEILFFIQQLEEEPQESLRDKITQRTQVRVAWDDPGLPDSSLPVDTLQEIVTFLEQHISSSLRSDLHTSCVYQKFCGKTQPTTAPCARESTPSGDHSTPHMKAAQCDQSSDLQILNTLLMLEGLEIFDPSAHNTAGLSSDMEVKRSLERCRGLVRSVCSMGVEHDGNSAGQNSTTSGGSRGALGNPLLSEKMVVVLVELLTSQVKDKLLVITCLQLTYLVMSKYDWRVLFAMEGGVRAVLGCMQEHQSSAAIQHIGLAVLKVLTGVGSSDVRGGSRRLNAGDSQVIKEIFSSIGSAASGNSTSLLRAIPGAIAKMSGVDGCSSSVYNGLLVVQMLTENHKALSEHLFSAELSSVLQRFSKDSGRSVTEPQRHLLSRIMHSCVSELKAGGLGVESTECDLAPAVQEMDLMSLLSALKDSQMCRDILPSLERCICDEVSYLRCDVPQLLTDHNFFLQLLSCLEQLRSDRHLQLCIYRIFNKSLHLFDEDTLPWHKIIAPSLSILGAASCDRELIKEVIHFLYSLASLSKDCATVMACLGASSILTKVQEKQSCDQQMTALKDLVSSCEQYAALHNKMAASIVAGCMQIVLAQIDDHRLHKQKLCLPLLDAFLQSLARACTRTQQKEDKCWEKIEVSSSPHQANKLTDGNPKSYWESIGSSGSHYINIYMQRGVIIRQLVMVVASEDSSYMPARVVVMGGDSQFSINTELNAVNIASTAGRVVLLENVTRFWPIIQIKIKRCQQGGIDTRVRGLEILGPKPTFWPVFKEQLCRRTFLFYTSRAHSWGQEIRDKKENLLQLFSRLNRALSHEREFADRFLPDDEAAQALGRTCWEALISPLVQSIASSDSGGISPLGWLLTRYLENSQGSVRPKFNSRVRRLTHLLVRVDTNQLDTAVLKSPSRSNGKKRDASTMSVSTASSNISSRAGIAQCWQEVVQRQVLSFMEKSWDDVDLVQRLCSMYLALRQAMEEMFGQHTCFLHGLQQGFCKGLLQLSFLTALHVTEQFARYIDQQIVAIRSDSTDVQSLEQLQQFLEFVIFLSDLELANSFEHFYRLYLADRLLSLGPFWLENSVVDHIGICFPNRFPQQMLKNLQEAKCFQRDQHLYRLQELDSSLLSEEEEMVSAEDDCTEDGSVDVEVCVLASQCWPIYDHTFLDDPQKYFPCSLTDPLRSFTNIYKKRPPVSADVPQSGQLQWTWLGNAEVQYGNVILQVSTLQMFILLQFNDKEEISEEAIARWKGISDKLLRDSLEALKGQKGILKVCEETKGLYVNTPALCGGSSSVLKLTPDRTDIQAAEMEEKRRVLLELIGRVMDEGRGIHIDMLVLKVLDSYRKQKVAVSSPDCGATDVLSLVMRLLREGAIHRKASNPLILYRKQETAAAPPPLPPMMSHTEVITPIPPQVSEFCSVRKITSNVGPVPEERPTFRTFRYPE
ncbi:cullin-9-like [Hyperolius riggenbachi]|uniref:cullin-9-like n=1 Tax=Hyperolius riggenbachi TaxID=752182 RepID=UPI0035A3BABE